MFYMDDMGYPVERYKDGGDSCVRAGIRAQGGATSLRVLRQYYPAGMCMRHPFQRPWNNPKNFTVDQLTVLLAGMKVYGEQEMMKTIFGKYAARGFLGMNTQRDWPGTTKYPWPHKVQDYQSDPLNPALPKPVGKPHWKMFDGPDLLFLRLDILYAWAKEIKSPFRHLFAIFGVAQFLLGVLLNSMKCLRFVSGHPVEQNQIISLCRLYGPWAVKLYRRVTPRWREHLIEYWKIRDEAEYADILLYGVENA